MLTRQVGISWSRLVWYVPKVQKAVWCTDGFTFHAMACVPWTPMGSMVARAVMTPSPMTPVATVAEIGRAHV